ncbi:hypothetical protein [Hansschlegelia plantiphila]|uniref:Uncharacterized protein n=1 Tax=Hansschlegelia plantiphila TaxID=374655 RepID=A0A9W6IZ91_9HYPH|nr:hypothetical protein [Hansschlegelia plantiphila]GLK67890.1 hypothetical protein GCM10008179_15280 [Hansschlegelia plantiphila]
MLAPAHGPLVFDRATYAAAQFATLATRLTIAAADFMIVWAAAKPAFQWRRISNDIGPGQPEGKDNGDYWSDIKRQRHRQHPAVRRARLECIRQ